MPADADRPMLLIINNIPATTDTTSQQDT